MARVKDLWFSEVPVRDAEGKAVKGQDGRVVREKRKTAKHPERGGSRDAKRWLAIWLDPDANEKTKAFAKKEAATAYAKKMEADAERDEYVDPKAGKAKFGALAQKWLRLRGVGGASRVRYESVFRNHVEPAFGHRGVKAVKPSDVLDWLNNGDISKLGDVMKEMAYFIVAGTFDLAVEDKVRRDNPARSKIITPPKPELMKRGLWSAGMVWSVIDAHPEEYRAIPVVAAGMGLRQGCAFGLAEDDFDFEAGKAEIRRQVVRVGAKYYFKAPKGGKTRTVPVSRGVASCVQAHIAKYPPVEVTLPWMSEKGVVAADPVTVRLLFAWHGDDKRTHGREIRANTYDGSVWNAALSQAGIAPAPTRAESRGLRYTSGGRENGMHALRHFYSNALQDAGVPPAGAMDFMGHSRKRLPVTFRVYGHVTDETFEQARAAVDRTLFKLRTASSPGTVTELRSAQ